MDAKLQIVLAIIGSGILTTILNRIFAVQDRKREKDTVLVKAQRASLKVQVRSLAKKYIAEGSIDHDDMEDIMELWRIYHEDLGGNGYLDAIMEKVKRLPLKTEG